MEWQEEPGWSCRNLEDTELPRMGRSWEIEAARDYARVSSLVKAKMQLSSLEHTCDETLMFCDETLVVHLT